VLIDHVASDVRPFQVPLLRERLAAPPTTNELRMAQLHFLPGEETLRYGEDLLASSFRRRHEVGVARVIQRPFHFKAVALDDAEMSPSNFTKKFSV
jgi:hypothetical protein